MKRISVILCSFVLGAFLKAQTDYSTINIDGEPCGPHGNAKAKREYDQNPFKNRWISPQKKDISSVTIQDLVKGGEDRERFKQEQAVEVVGFVYDVKVGGIETCNCKTTTQQFRDTHIEITPGPEDTSPDKRVIIEITPRMRQILEKQGVDWTTSSLKKSLKNRTIRVQGWLFYDFSHELEAFSYDPKDNQGRNNWRASCWEIHPVTAMEILDAEPEEYAGEDENERSLAVTKTGFFNIEGGGNSTSPNFNSSKITEPPTNDPGQLLKIILLAAILGMCGQVIRVFAGLSKVKEKAPDDRKNMKDVLTDNSSQMVFSLFIALIVGGVCGVLVAVSSDKFVADKATIVALITAGYAGTDFIEGFIAKR